MPTSLLPSSPLKAFLCYSREDALTVSALYQQLKADGFEPWMDRIDMVAGKNWENEITKFIRSEAHSVLVLLSRRSLKEGFVRREMGMALKIAEEKPEGNFLIPLRLEECEVPLQLGHLHWEDLFASGGYERLIRALEYRARDLGLSIPLGERFSAESPNGSRSVFVHPQDGLEYVKILPGKFLMGAVPDDFGAEGHERPQHSVTITKGFWISRGPVSVAAYRAFVERRGSRLPSEPRFNQGWAKDDHPIVNISWLDSQSYCEWAGGRLPTEAEWEYVARGGREGLLYPWRGPITHLNANYVGSKWVGTSPIGAYPPSDWGLLDIAGNVWEWVSDWYGKKYFEKWLSDNPSGPANGTQRVLRGGSWFNSPWTLRLSARLASEPSGSDDDIGFRCVREVFP